MIQVSVVYRHFAGVVELGVVHDDLRLQFCSQSRAGMKRGRLVEEALIRYPDSNRHLVDTRVLATVELDLRFGFHAHYKTRKSIVAVEFRNYFS